MLPPEPDSDTPWASDRNEVPFDGMDPDLAALVENLYWDFDSWNATRADDVKLFSILASGSGFQWQHRVQDARRNGATLPLTDAFPPAERRR